MVRIGIGKTSSKGWGFICDTKFWLLTVWTTCRLRNQRFRFRRGFCGRRCGIRGIVMLRRMGIWPLDLHKAFGAYRLITTSCLVQVWWVIKEANRTFRSILIQEHFESLAIDIWIFWELYLTRYQL
jgi:hypothetical protein